MNGMTHGKIATGTVVLMLFAFAAACSFADEIVVRGVPFSDVKITSATPRTITFRFGHGRTITKSLSEVDRISLPEATNFNQAEKLYSQGKQDEAIRFYKLALSETQTPWKKALVQHRLARAKQPDSQPVRSRAKPEKREICHYCHDTKLMTCPTCRATGLTKCQECQGRRQVTCSTCEGQWRKDPCQTCNGTGWTWKTKEYKKLVKRRRSVGKDRVLTGSRNEYETIYRRVKVDCEAWNLGRDGRWRCNGRGYRWFCPACEKQRIRKLRGTMRCPSCHGTGLSGQCPVCKGTKKVACKLCKAAGRLGEPGTPTPGKTTEDTNPLGTADALALALAREPADPRKQKTTWEKLTSLQQAEALAKYKKELTAHREGKRFVGKRVSWRLLLEDIIPGTPTDTYIVRARSEKAIIIQAALKAGTARAPLMKLKKGEPIQITGIISAHHFAQAPEKGIPHPHIEIADAVLVTPPKAVH